MSDGDVQDGWTPAREAARRALARHHLSSRHAPRHSAQPRWFRAIVAYDGGPWAGWQRQRDAVSVGEMLLAALEIATDADVSMHAAGRTDSGVHADGQAVSIVVHTQLPASALHHICQMLLPDSIRVPVVEVAPAGWNPQRECVEKLYRYRILEAAAPSPSLERAAWRHGVPLDLDAMQTAAGHLRGTHDFRAFRNDPGDVRRGESTVRTVSEITFERALGQLHIDVRGPGFLYKMVRNLTAVLVEVGLGLRPPDWVGELLASRNRHLGPPPAPARGLTLVGVRYADGFGGW